MEDYSPIRNVVQRSYPIDFRLNANPKGDVMNEEEDKAMA
jgi:hypothetical protein